MISVSVVGVVKKGEVWEVRCDSGFGIAGLRSGGGGFIVECIKSYFLAFGSSGIVLGQGLRVGSLGLSLSRRSSESREHDYGAAWVELGRGSRGMRG